MTQQTSPETKIAALDSELVFLDGGYINHYSGTQPTTTTEELDAQTLLCSNSLGSPAFGAAVEISATQARATANAIAGSTAVASGLASFYRAFGADDVCHRQGSIGTSNADLIMSNPNIIEGGSCTIPSWTVTKG